jgi:hypothetical protein
MKTPKHQQGMVLVIGLLYLLVAMIACFSTLENVGVLALEQAGSIRSYKSFYLLESKLEKIENTLIEQVIYQEQLDSFLDEKNIIDISTFANDSSFETRWLSNNSELFVKDDAISLIEFLGNKPIEPLKNMIMPAQSHAWLFRVSVAYQSSDYFLETIVQVYPQEFISFLEKNNIQESYASQRIAWYERIVDE